MVEVKKLDGGKNSTSRSLELTPLTHWEGANSDLL